MQVALFVTCLVDLMRPRVGFAALELLEQAGCEVDVPLQQSCCGQPAYNSGDFQHARSIARRVIETFEPYSHVVAPSGSCAGMLRHHYPLLFEHSPQWLDRARALGRRTFELTEFLRDVAGVQSLPARFAHTVTYHDSCSCLREMSIERQPRALLQMVEGLRLHELPRREECCGFGGTFCVKYPDISTHMVDRKLDAIDQSGAEVLLAADLGCLLHMAGRLSRRGAAIRVYHVAEVLASMADGPAIGDPEPR